jgi:hypothetical protein
MTTRSFGRAPAKSQRGYALLMVIFLVATLLVVAIGGSLSIRTEGLREKETELAWRGEQYVRAIRLFYKKNGRFPKTMDELIAYHTDQPRYIRQPYKDPMNTGDGSWKLIYVLPNGQLSGTVLHKQLQGALPISGGPLGGNPVGGVTPAAPTSGIGQQPSSGIGAQPPAATAQPASPTQSDSQTSDSPVFGGSVIGVVSKINKPSIRIYKDGKSYNEWEFYWDPSAVGALPGGVPAGTTPPTTPATPTTPGQPQNPGQSPGSGQ